MKRIFTLLALALLLAGSADTMAQSRPKGGKKAASPFIEGRQKVRQTDYDTIWQFSNLSTKSTNIYYSPYDYTAMLGLVTQKNPQWGCLRPVINYLEKSSRATMTVCAIYAVNPDIEDHATHDRLAKQAATEAKSCLDAFEAWKAKKEWRNKVQYYVAEVDYRYFKGANYYNAQTDDEIIHVGLLLYFGSKKRPVFDADTVSRTFPDIRFFPNDATIVDSWETVLDELSDYLKENDRKGVMLTGYSDNHGTAAYTLGVSRQRAMEVKKALIMRGIDENRIEVVAKGDEDPVGDNDDKEAFAKNNRVSIKIQ